DGQRRSYRAMNRATVLVEAIEVTAGLGSRSRSLRPPAESLNMRRTRVLGAVAAALLLGATGGGVVIARAATPALPVVPAAIADGPCGPGSKPETTQGRVSTADVTSGRAAQGYTCNAE